VRAVLSAACRPSSRSRNPTGLSIAHGMTPCLEE
jgi:hypothetical protein